MVTIDHVSIWPTHDRVIDLVYKCPLLALLRGSDVGLQPDGCSLFLLVRDQGIRDGRLLADGPDVLSRSAGRLLARGSDAFSRTPI